MLEKFGFSQSCECCARIQRGDSRRSAHSAACRARMYECLNTDDEERPKLEKALDRVADKDARRNAAKADAGTGLQTGLRASEQPGTDTPWQNPPSKQR